MRTDFDLPCNELKNQLITIIENTDCEDELLLAFKSYFDIAITDPISRVIYEKDKTRFNDECIAAGIKIQDEFIISKESINKIIGENWDKEFLHIFFRDNNGDLDILFRFSDIETFISTNGSDIELDFKNESAYLLKSGNVEKLNTSSFSFSDYTKQFKDGVANKIDKINDSNLTEYVTYKMKKIFLFNGFEQDIKFEVICIYENGKNRLGICAYIKDKHRIHHINSSAARIYEGYYDLGNLKP